MARAPRRGRRSGRGAVTVELALVLGLCFTFLMAIFEYGRLLMVRDLMDIAAIEGARLAAAGTDYSPGVSGTNGDGTLTSAEVIANVNYLLSQQASGATVQVYATDTSGNAISGTAWNAGTFATGIAVQIDTYFTPMVPTFGMLPSTLHLTSKAVMQTEANN